jgi:hypothetical protein
MAILCRLFPIVSTLQRPSFSLCFMMGWALTMKTLERQRLRWNDEIRYLCMLSINVNSITL